MALDNNANWIKCGFSLLYYSLNYLLKLQPLQSMRLFLRVKQANTGFAGVKSQADVLPQWSPSHSGLHFQLSHVLKLYLLKACEERHKRQACRNTAAEKSLYWDLHQTGTSERKEITDGICWTWYIWGRLFLVQNPAPQKLKILKSGYHILLARASCFHHSLKTPAVLSALICPESLPCISAAQKLDSKLSSLCPSLSLCHLRGSRRLSHSFCLFFKMRWVLIHCSACTLLQAHGDLKFKDC